MLGDASADNDAIRRYPREVYGDRARNRFPMHPHSWTQLLMLREEFAQARAAGGRDLEVARGPSSAPTAQELRVCLAVAEGATDREAAEMLFLSPTTVEYHLGRVFTKLGVGNRAQLTRLVVDGALAAPEAL